MINIIDLKDKCSYFVCDDEARQRRIGQIFGIEFSNGVSKTPVSYLRKQIIKKACYQSL
jgi:hypothetical protein